MSDNSWDVQILNLTLASASTQQVYEEQGPSAVLSLQHVMLRCLDLTSDGSGKLPVQLNSLGLPVNATQVCIQLGCTWT